MKAANLALPTAALVETPILDPVGLVRGLDAVGYNPDFDLIRPEDIPDLRRAGVEVYVWTVNDPQQMRVLIQNGASGIITDFPQRLSEILQGRD